jgi:hypothetical protein
VRGRDWWKDLDVELTAVDPPMRVGCGEHVADSFLYITSYRPSFLALELCSSQAERGRRFYFSKAIENRHHGEIIVLQEL